jgi:ClpP class serine protease
MGTDTMTALADGSSVTGTEALTDGLVDKIGNIDDVRKYLAGKISGDAVICGVDN